MAIDFPSNPSDGYVWTDSAGTKWVFTLADNSWDKVKPPSEAGDISYTYPGGVEQTVQEKFEQILSIDDFGAVADCLEFNCGSMVAGSDVFTSTEPVFDVARDSADAITGASKKIAIRGAIDSSINSGVLCTAITSVIDEYSVKIRNTKPPTETGQNISFSFGSDNTSVFESIRAHIDSTGKKTGVFIPAGNYSVSSFPGVRVPSNAIYYGVGAASQLTTINEGVGSLGFGQGMTQGNYRKRLYRNALDVTEGDEYITMQTAGDASLVGTGLKLIRSLATHTPGDTANPVFSELVDVIYVDDTNNRLYLRDPITYSFVDVLVAKANEEAPGENITTADDWVKDCAAHDLTVRAFNPGSPLSTNGLYRGEIYNITFDGMHRIGTNNLNRVHLHDCKLNTYDGGLEFKTASINSVVENIDIHYVSGYVNAPTPKLQFIDIGENAKAITVRNINGYCNGRDLGGGVITFQSTTNPGCTIENIYVKAKKASNLVNVRAWRYDSPGNLIIRNVYAAVDELSDFGVSLTPDSIDDPTAAKLKGVYFENIACSPSAVVNGNGISVGGNYETFPDVVFDNIRVNAPVKLNYPNPLSITTSSDGYLINCNTGYFEVIEDVQMNVQNNMRFGEGTLWKETFRLPAHEVVTSTTTDEVWKTCNFPALPNYTYGVDKIKFEGSIRLNQNDDHFFTVGDGTNFTPSFPLGLGTHGEIVFVSGEVLITKIEYNLTVLYTSNAGNRIETVTLVGDPRITPYPLTFRLWSASGASQNSQRLYSRTRFVWCIVKRCPRLTQWA